MTWSTDHEQFFHTGANELFGFGEDVVDRAGGKIAAKLGDDAEAAAIVTTLGNLEVGIVARRKAQACLRHEVEMGVVWGCQVGVDRRHDVFVLMRAGDGEYLRVGPLDHVRFGAEAAGDDDFPVGLYGFSDRFETLVAGAVEEAARIDQDEVGAGIVGCDLVAFGAQAGDDTFGIHERLRAAEGNDTDFWRAGAECGCCHGGRFSTSRGVCEPIVSAA